MRGITIVFNGEKIHTGNDLDLVQEAKKIEKPIVQSFTAEVPGRNGLVNLTKGITGRVMYYNRPLTFQYFGTGTRSHLLNLDSILSRYHGQMIRIIDDDYPDYYYEGEATVTADPKENYTIFTIEVDAYPFRVKLAPTVVSRELNGTPVTLYLRNENAEVIPTITVTADTKIKFNNREVTLSAGVYEIESFILVGGLNIFEVTGTGTIRVEYQEGAI